MSGIHAMLILVTREIPRAIKSGHLLDLFGMILTNDLPFAVHSDGAVLFIDSSTTNEEKNDILEATK